MGDKSNLDLGELVREIIPSPIVEAPREDGKQSPYDVREIIIKRLQTYDSIMREIPENLRRKIAKLVIEALVMGYLGGTIHRHYGEYNVPQKLKWVIEEYNRRTSI